MSVYGVLAVYCVLAVCSVLTVYGVLTVYCVLAVCSVVTVYGVLAIYGVLVREYVPAAQMKWLINVENIFILAEQFSDK